MGVIFLEYDMLACGVPDETLFTDEEPQESKSEKKHEHRDLNQEEYDNRREIYKDYQIHELVICKSSAGHETIHSKLECCVV
jgi:hypothetical protein